jgi:hypothetical protein
LDGGGAEPASTQLTVMLPEPSGVAEKLEQLSCVAYTGAGATKNPPEATAAASTRLILRLICMVYLENRRHVAAIAPGSVCKPCATCRSIVMTVTFFLAGIRRTDDCRGQTVHIVLLCGS